MARIRNPKGTGPLVAITAITVAIGIGAAPGTARAASYALPPFAAALEAPAPEADASARARLDGQGHRGDQDNDPHGDSDGSAAGDPFAPAHGRVRAPVEIIRDRYGVNHIYARNAHDLFFAQGYGAARDRLWQLDQWRRRGEGRMAEQFGPRFIEADRAARLFLYRGDLEAEFASYHPHGRQILTAFAAGINAWIDEVRRDPSRMPIEFRLTGTEPGYWSPTSPLIRIYGLTRNLTTEVALARRIAAAGVATTEALTIQHPPGEPIEIPAGLDVGAIPVDVLADYDLGRNGLPFVAADFERSPLSSAERATLAANLSRSAATTPASDHEREALQFQSNNWTLAGTLTATGRPLLANDPHRAITMPSLRYLVHLEAPGWKVIGAGEPALPGVSIGHNDRVAFGLTIFAFGDEEDLYVYELDPDDPGRYRYDGQWEAMRIITEAIPVRGQAAAEVTQRFTRHGPVIHLDRAAGKAYALRAAWLEFPGTAAYLASLRLNQARDWSEFTAGMARHYTPSENMVYADVDGNIGWFGGSITPIRPVADWSGLLPVPGDGRYEWAGYLPGDLLPRIFNPREGFVATANAFNVPADYPYRRLTNRVGWADPYRSDRIHEVLRAGSRFTRVDSERLQNDHLSIPARTLVPLLARLGTADAAVADGLGRLRDWDHVASAGSAAATIFELWLAELTTRVSAILVPADARAAFGAVPRPIVIERLTAPDAASFGPDPAAARDAVLLDALKAAMATLTRLQGADPARWAWGDLHHIQFDHSLTPVLAPGVAEQLGTARFPVGGTGDTVGVAHYRLSDFRVISGASFRQVLDVGDWDNSVAINVPGQSGDPSSPWYSNLLEPWSKGEYFPLAFSRRAVEAIRADRTTLEPPR